MTAASTGHVRHLRVVQPHVTLGDPHVCSDDRHRLGLLHALYDPLVRRAAGGVHRPALARRWDVDRGAQRWRFDLDPEARCSDGGPMSADDVVASLVRVRDDAPAGELGTSGVYAGYLQGARIAADGIYRVEIDLPDPNADLLDVLVELFVVPERHLADAATTPPGSGPWRVVERGGEAVVMETWSNAAAPTRASWWAEPDARVRRDAVRAGDADIASDVPSDASGDDILWRPSSVATTFMFALDRGATRDRRVRRALNHAVDVPALIEALFHGRAARTASPCTATQLGYDPGLAPLAYDPGLARRLLDEAGGSSELTFDIPSRLPDEAPALAALLRGQLAEVGLRLEIVEHADRPAYAEAVRAKRIHDAACFDSSPHSTFRLLQEKFHAGARGPWWLGYTSDAVDRLADEARSTVDVDARRDLYRDAARRLRDDAPWLFLYGPQWGWAVGEHAAGWTPTPDGLVAVPTGRPFAAANGVVHRA
jgi:peptide/nickel transport system substrate-binding protein